MADELKQTGILLVASSGRQYDNLRRKFQPIAREMGFVCENGGLNALGREIVSVHPMDRAAVLSIIQTLQGLGLSVLLSGVRCCYTWAGDRSFCDEMVYGLRNTMTIVDDFSQIDDEFIKLAAYHPGTIEPFMDRLQQKWGAAVNVARSGMEWCDFNLSNKGMGLKDLMRRLNIAPAEAAAFGDNYNDESMLCEVGHPFLMESADAAFGSRASANAAMCWTYGAPSFETAASCPEGAFDFSFGGPFTRPPASPPIPFGSQCPLSGPAPAAGSGECDTAFPP